MKRLIMLAVLMIAAISGVSAATTVDVNWSGYGNFDTTFNSGGDAVIKMWANGHTGGNFYAEDIDNNTYSYGVDDTNAWMKGDITTSGGIGGGTLRFQYERTNSYVPMYGEAGQISNSFVGSSGIGALNFRVGSNYASLGSSNYDWQSNAQFSATGDFEIMHELYTGLNNGGKVYLFGTGSAVVDHMTDSARGVNPTPGYYNSVYSPFNFGAGGGCYTNANIEATGYGIAAVSGNGDGSLYANDNSWSMPVGGSHTESWTYNDGLSVNNYAFGGN